MGRFARGKYSYGIDDRSGWKVRYKDLKTEWTGVRVDKRIWEPKHESVTPVRVVHDPQSLHDPRPDSDTGATSYPTMNYSATQPGYATWGPTTQLHEVLMMTFGTGTA
jgi:hypothetical protein